jgi:hypothetical protein
LIPADGARGRRSVLSAHAPVPGARARRSDSSGSGQRTRRRGGAGRTSAGSGEMRISGCGSNWGFPPRRRHSSRRRRRRKKKKKKKKDRGRISPTGGSPHPRHRSRLRWRENRRLGRARGRSPPGSLRRGRRGPQRCRRAPRRRRCAWQMLTVKIRQPSHEFTFGVGMSFIPYPLVLTPVV